MESLNREAGWRVRGRDGKSGWRVGMESLDGDPEWRTGMESHDGEPGLRTGMESWE